MEFDIGQETNMQGHYFNSRQTLVGANNEEDSDNPLNDMNDEDPDAYCSRAEGSEYSEQ
jgi:hypothetical protein